MKKPKARPAAADPSIGSLTVWGKDGVEVVGILNGKPVGRCRFGGESAASFEGDERLNRAMLEAAIEAVKQGALGELPADRRVRLP